MTTTETISIIGRAHRASRSSRGTLEPQEWYPIYQTPKDLFTRGVQILSNRGAQGVQTIPRISATRGVRWKDSKASDSSILKNLVTRGVQLYARLGAHGVELIPQGIRALGVSDGIVQVQPVHQPRRIWSPRCPNVPMEGRTGCPIHPRGHRRCPMEKTSTFSL